MKNVLLIVGLLLVGFVAYGIYGGAGDPVARSADSANENVTPIDYFISVQAMPISAYVVSLDVMNNIPLPVEVMASVSVKGQAPTDIYIGVGKKVKLTTPEQTIELDGMSENLPSGDYTAEVAFYPRWGAKNGTKQAKAIMQKIVGAVDVILSGSGESIGQANQRNDAQMWVMENVIFGTAWNEGLFVQRMGSLKNPLLR